MAHPLEILSAFVVGCGVIVMAAFTWPPLPRAKPEEFVLPPAEFVEPASQEQTAVIRVQPSPPKTEQQRVDAVAEQLSAAKRDLFEIKKALKKSKPPGDGGS